MSGQSHEGMPGPLERADAVRDKVIRIIFAIVLLVVVLIGFFDAAIFFQTVTRPGFSSNAIVIGFGTLGSSSMFVAGWTLLHVGMYSPWRLFALSAMSAVFALLGLTLIVGAH